MNLTKCLSSGCAKEVSPGMIMCFHHWRMVPLQLKRNAWNAYRVGLEMGSGESNPMYVQAVDRVRTFVTEKERHE